MKHGDIDIRPQDLHSLCKRWKIRRLVLFGSAFRREHRPDNDIDLLVDFQDDEQGTLLDLARAEIEFEQLLGRKVDLVDRKGVERSTNWIRRDAILNSGEVVYGS